MQFDQDCNTCHIFCGNNVVMWFLMYLSINGIQWETKRTKQLGLGYGLKWI